MKSSNFDSDPQTQCRQCATCCRKGGPALHREDLALVAEGRIPLNALETLRQGERATDNVHGGVIRLPMDLIKIRGGASQPTCRFLVPSTNTCDIYDHRPLECRLLKCWAPQTLADAYRHTRLERQDLFGDIPWLWDLIRDHHSRCDYERIYALIDSFRAQGPSSPPCGDLGEIIAYDAHLRDLIATKIPQLENQMDLLLGRPLPLTLRPLGISLTPSSGGWTLRDTASPTQ